MQIIELAGVPTAVAGDATSRTLIAFLHGNGMQPLDLVPFAGSLGVPALFLFPRGPVSTLAPGYAWWPVDHAKKAIALQSGPRDLFDRQPAGLAAARELLGDFLHAAAVRFNAERIVLGGFSQGAMLACDWALRAGRPIDALVLLSASRIDFPHWEACRNGVAQLRVFVSHGRHDPDLAFAAGEQLRDFLICAGAAVSWLPFDGGHEIPLIVWSRLRRFLGEVLQEPKRCDLPTASPLA